MIKLPSKLCLFCFAGFLASGVLYAMMLFFYFCDLALQCMQGTLLSCVLVSIIWGTTNVLIKRSTLNITKIRSSNWIDQLYNEFCYILLNWKWCLSFGANQIGSVLFYFVLLYSELSLVVPITNSLTFLFTAATSIAFGESVPSSRTICGASLVLFGITLCVIDKLSVSE